MGSPLHGVSVMWVFQSWVRFLRPISQRLLIKKGHSVHCISGRLNFMARHVGNFLLSVGFSYLKLCLFLMIRPELLLKSLSSVWWLLAVRNWSRLLAKMVLFEFWWGFLVLKPVLDVSGTNYQFPLRRLHHCLVLHLLFHLLQRAELGLRLLLRHPVLLAATEAWLRWLLSGQFGLGRLLLQALAEELRLAHLRETRRLTDLLRVASAFEH